MTKVVKDNMILTKSINFKVKSLIVENHTTKIDNGTGIKAVLASMKDQTVPLFRMPHLPWFSLVCFVHFGIFAT